MAQRDGTKTAKNPSLIDPIYQKYVKGVVRAIGSTAFYEFFMDAIARAENEFQFSNRKLLKTVDLTWVDAIDRALEPFEAIIGNPRNFIMEEELIVNVANARKTGSETVRHLVQHSALVEQYDDQKGDVRPGRLMQRYRDDSITLYENRLVYTTLEMAFNFVKIRHDALFSAMSDEFGAKLKVKSDMDSATEHVHLDMFLHIRDTDSALKTDAKHEDVFGRISRMYRVLGVYMNSTFADELSKAPRVKGKITKTNVLKRNKNYKTIVELLEFMRTYDDIGYSIKIVEQNPQINEVFERDIYHNILFNYLVLKGYLEDESDRTVPTAPKERRRALKPKFIKEIIEELTEDYDLPDVEIRKVLIEELTKEQLMREEAEERRRLVEEQAQRKKAEEERIRAEKKAEQERLKAERAAERERIRREKEAEQERLRQERMEREMEDRRRGRLFRDELEYFHETLDEHMMLREKEAEKRTALSEKEDFAEAAAMVEAEERRRQELLERKRRRRAEERERARLEKLEEQERLARLQREAEEAERRAEQERLRLQQEQEEQARQAQLAADMEHLQVYLAEFHIFENSLDARRAERAEYLRQEEQERQTREQERRLRRARKGAGS